LFSKLKPTNSSARKQGKSVTLYAAKFKQIKEQIGNFNSFPAEVQIEQRDSEPTRFMQQSGVASELLCL
jgi:hypothetical protein